MKVKADQQRGDAGVDEAARFIVTPPRPLSAKRNWRWGIAACLVLTVLLSGCDFYDGIVNFTPDPLTLPQFTPPAPPPIIIPYHVATAIDFGSSDVQCSDSNWFVSWFYDIVAGAVAKFVGGALDGGWQVFVAIVNGSIDLPLNGGPAEWVFTITTGAALALIGLAVVLAGLRQSVSGFNTLAVGQVLPKALGLWIALMYWRGGGESILSYAINIPPLLSYKVFAWVLEGSANALVTLTDMSGVFAGGHPCNLLALIPIILFGVVLAVFYMLLALLVLAQEAVLKVYAIFIPIVLAASLIDELKPYTGQVVDGYIRASISVVPIGFILLLMSVTVADPATLNGDGWQIAAAMLKAAIYMFIAIKLMQGLLSGGGARLISAARGMAKTVVTGGATGGTMALNTTARGVGRVGLGRDYEPPAGKSGLARRRAVWAVSD